MQFFMKTYSPHPERKICVWVFFRSRSTDVARRATSIQPTFISPTPLSISISVSISVSISPLPLLPSALFCSNPGNGMLLGAPSRCFCHKVKDCAEHSGVSELVRWVHFVDMLLRPQKEARNVLLGTWRRGSLLGCGRHVNKIVVSSDVQRRKCKRPHGTDGQGPVGGGSPMWVTVAPCGEHNIMNLDGFEHSAGTDLVWGSSAGGHSRARGEF